MFRLVSLKYCLDWFHSNIDVAGGGHRQPISSCNECPTETGDQKLVAEGVACPRSLSWSTFFFGNCLFLTKKGGSGASGRVLPPVTGRSRVRVAVSSHCTGEGKACH